MDCGFYIFVLGSGLFDFSVTFEGGFCVWCGLWVVVVVVVGLVGSGVVPVGGVGDVAFAGGGASLVGADGSDEPVVVPGGVGDAVPGGLGGWGVVGVWWGGGGWGSWGGGGWGRILWRAGRLGCPVVWWAVVLGTLIRGGRGWWIGRRVRGRGGGV